jgi:alcohol dehydrogenase, propanol-preferring
MGWPVNGKPPFIPGHEGVGIVESLGGRGNRGRGGQPGRLAMARIRCGTCGYCSTGWETLCEQQRNTGYSVDGGYAEYAAATAKYVARCQPG